MAIQMTWLASRPASKVATRRSQSVSRGNGNPRWAIAPVYLSRTIPLGPGVVGEVSGDVEPGRGDAHVVPVDQPDPLPRAPRPPSAGGTNTLARVRSPCTTVSGPACSRRSPMRRGSSASRRAR